MNAATSEAYLIATSLELIAVRLEIPLASGSNVRVKATTPSNSLSITASQRIDTHRNASECIENTRCARRVSASSVLHTHEVASSSLAGTTIAIRKLPRCRFEVLLERFAHDSFLFFSAHVERWSSTASKNARFKLVTFVPS